jgi:hypothetical protein
MPKGVIWAGVSAGSNQLGEIVTCKAKTSFSGDCAWAPCWNPMTNPITMSHRAIRLMCGIWRSPLAMPISQAILDLTLAWMSLEHHIFNALSVFSALQQVVRGFPGHPSFVHEMSDDTSYHCLVVELSH